MRASQEPFLLRRLKVVADIRPSGVDKLTSDSEQPVSLCNYVDVYKNSRISSGLSFMQASATLAEVERFTLRSGDVLITKDSETPDDIAAAALVEESAAGVICGYHLALLRPKGICRGDYLYWCLNSPNTLSQFTTRAQGITRFGLTISAIGEILVPMPPTNTQHAIASFLDRETGKIDALVGEQERLIALLKEKRQAVISQAVTRGLDPTVPMKHSGVEWLGDVPSHWLVSRAKMLFRRSDLPVPADAEVVTCFRDGQVTLRRNRREDGFTMAVLEVGYQGIRPGQLVLHSMDAFAGAIGVSDSVGKCSPEYLVCEQIGNDAVPRYYGRMLRLMALRGFILAACPSVRERAPRIRFPEFGEMVLPVPSSYEQTLITDYIDRLETKSAGLQLEAERAIVLLRERRAALIAAAVTGKIDVREHADISSAQAA